MPDSYTLNPQQKRAAHLEWLSDFITGKLNHFDVQRTNQDSKKADRNGNFFYFQDHKGGQKPEDRVIIVFTGKDAKDAKVEALDYLHEEGINTGKDDSFPRSFVIVLAHHVPLKINDRTVVLNGTETITAKRESTSVRPASSQELDALNMIIEFHRRNLILGVANKVDYLIFSDDAYFAEFNYISEGVALEVLDFFSKFGIEITNRVGKHKQEAVILRFHLAYDYNQTCSYKFTSEFVNTVSDALLIEFLFRKILRLKCSTGKNLVPSKAVNEAIIGSVQKDISTRYQVHATKHSEVKELLQAFDVHVFWNKREAGSFFLPISEGARKLVRLDANLDIVKVHELLKDVAYISSLPLIETKRDLESKVEIVSKMPADTTPLSLQEEFVSETPQLLSQPSTSVLKQIKKLLRKLDTEEYLELLELMEAKLKIIPTESDRRITLKGWDKLLEKFAEAEIICLDGSSEKLLLPMSAVKIEKAKLQLRISDLPQLNNEEIIKKLKK